LRGFASRASRGAARRAGLAADREADGGGRIADATAALVARRAAPQPSPPTERGDRQAAAPPCIATA